MAKFKHSKDMLWLFSSRVRCYIKNQAQTFPVNSWQHLATRCITGLPALGDPTHWVMNGKHGFAVSKAPKGNSSVPWKSWV